MFISFEIPVDIAESLKRKRLLRRASDSPDYMATKRLAEYLKNYLQDLLEEYPKVGGTDPE